MQTLELVLIIDKNPLREKRTLCRVIKVYLKGLFKVSWASQALFLGMYCNTSKHIYWTCVCVCVCATVAGLQSKSKTKVSDIPSHWSHHSNPFIVFCTWPSPQCVKFYASPLSSIPTNFWNHRTTSSQNYNNCFRLHSLFFSNFFIGMIFFFQLYRHIALKSFISSKLLMLQIFNSFYASGILLGNQVILPSIGAPGWLCW